MERKKTTKGSVGALPFVAIIYNWELYYEKLVFNWEYASFRPCMIIIALVT